jgi:hypothetical protein
MKYDIETQTFTETCVCGYVYEWRKLKNFGRDVLQGDTEFLSLNAFSSTDEYGYTTNHHAVACPKCNTVKLTGRTSG